MSRKYSEIMAEIDELSASIELSNAIGAAVAPFTYSLICSLDREFKTKLIEDDIFNWFYPETT